MKLKILACQINIPPTTTPIEKLEHVTRVIRQIDLKLTDDPVDMIVLPELSNIDYSRDAFSHLDQLAEDLDGPTASAYAELASRHNAFVVFGMATRRDGAYFITQVVLDNSGKLVGHYDKLHLAQYGASMEKEYFNRGEQLLVFDVAGVRISPIICYDIRVPELLRTLCIDNSVHLVLHCGAYGRDESFYSWHQFVVTRAMENLTYLLSLNRAGDFYGESIFCPPWVDGKRPETVFPSVETIKILEVDMGFLNEIRTKYPFLNDRLDDYTSLHVTAP